MSYIVKVPATSANIGAGFDTMGLALSLYNIFEFTELESGLEFEGFEEEFSNENNIVYTSMLKLFRRINYNFKGMKIKMKEQNIPVTRGLGSSSSCIIAGLLAANKFANDIFTNKEILEIATEIEGHPDNVAPALFGGFVVTIVENGMVYYNKVDLDENLSFFACIPEFELSTKEARAVLPKMYSVEDGIYNISRAALTTSAFCLKKYDLLDIACSDSFHEPYRKKYISDYDNVKNILKKNTINCSFLSGAGPTIMGIKILEKNFILNELISGIKNLDTKWSISELKAENRGAIVEER
ncbi:MAG: homoserine kinase [Sarcina sp.]